MSSTDTATKTRLRPVGDRIVVKENVVSKTASGIILPQTAEQKTQKGVVVSVGPGPRSPFTGEVSDMGLSEGDLIVFARHAGQEITVDSEEFLVIHEVDVVAVIESD